MTNPTRTLLERARPWQGDDITWVLPDADAGLADIASLRAVHPFRPGFLALENMRAAVTPQWPEQRARNIAICLPRQAEWAAGLIAQALQRLEAGGALSVIAPNDLGGKRYAKMLEQHFDLGFAESKHHCRIAALERPATLPPIVQEWLQAYTPKPVPGTDLKTMPGVFSHGRVDTGSVLLAQHLPALAGRVADFGGGWGYLAAQVLRAAPDVRVDLYEADDNAITLARDNLKSFGARAGFFWHDLLQEKTGSGYDSVVMNPPFHDLAAQNNEIGLGFIAAAHAALKQGGQLWMVANAHLPYEEALATRFATHRQIVRERGFKLLHATK